MKTGNTLELGRQAASGLQLKLLRSLHEAFGRTLAAGLTTFLQCEIQASLSKVGFVEGAEFRDSLPSPSCLVVFKLFPRQEQMVLRFDVTTVLGLLEIMLGGAPSGLTIAPRELTEIEWSLLEDLVRVLAQALGESWQSLVTVEFQVESQSIDPATLVFPDPALARFEFDLQWAEQTGMFEFVVPRTLFAELGGSAEEEAPPVDPDQADFERNLKLLENAQVELEVRLQGPTLAVNEILSLQPGQVITFDYSLQKSLHGLVNGDLAILGHIVSAGRRRAFQVERLP